MSHLDILLPFSLPPTEMAPDLLRALQVPALATLLSRAQTPVLQEFDAFSRALPHEIWLAHHAGLLEAQATNDSPQLATGMMRTRNLSADSGYWFVLQPVHIHVARDHLVLTDPRQLQISEQESRALFGTAKQLFEEAGKTLLFGDAGTWFVRTDDWSALQTSTPDAACGHNIDIWMPHDPDGVLDRAWRKLQNEVQMHWHTHPLNAQREARGAKPVNSVWIWGGASGIQIPAAKPYACALNLPAEMQAYGMSVADQMQNCSASELAAAVSGRGLLVLDGLLASGLAQDWSHWLAQMHALEANWFAPLLNALREGKISGMSLILTHNTKLSTLSLTRNSLRKFWVKPSLARLQT
jgi:hypothetical protein